MTGAIARNLTPAQIFGLLKQLTPAQMQLVMLFLLIENRPDRDVILTKLKALT